MKRKRMDEPRCQLNFRLTPEELALYDKAASHVGLKISAWLRMVALKAARRELRETAT